MGIKKSYNDALYHQLGIYAAWLPVTNTFKLGDYGLISDGVFVATGNIANLGITYTTATSPPTSFKFASEGASMVRFAAGVAVDSFPEVGTIDVALEWHFSRANSCLVLANSVAVEQMDNLEAVADALKNHKKWNRRNRVISSVYTGQKCAVICATEANSKVKLSGKVDAIKALELGAVSADLGFEASNSSVYQALGETGPIGLKMFRIGFFGGLHVLSADVAQAGASELQSDWGADIESDI